MKSRGSARRRRLTVTATVIGVVALTGAGDVRVAPVADDAIVASGRVAETATVLAMPMLAVPTVPKDAGFAPTPPASGAAPSRTTAPPAAAPLRLGTVAVREGDHVDAGQPLATVDQAQFRAAERLAAADVTAASSQVGVLDHAIAETRDKERELLDKRAEVEEALTTLRSKRAELVDKRAQAQQALAGIETGLPRLEQGLAKLDAGLGQARSGAATISARQREIRSGIAKLTAGRAQLVQAREQLRRALAAAARSRPVPDQAASSPAAGDSGRGSPSSVPGPSESPSPASAADTASPSDDAGPDVTERETTPPPGESPHGEATSGGSRSDARTSEEHGHRGRRDHRSERDERGHRGEAHRHRRSTAASRSARRAAPVRPSPRELRAKITGLDRRIATLDAQLAKARQGERALTTARRDVEAKVAQAERARGELLAKRAQARAARTKLTAGLAAMTDGLRRIDEGIGKAQDGLTKIDDGIEKIRDARRELQAARTQALIAVDAATVRRRQARLTRERTVLVAPVSGRVTQTADVGDVLSPGASVATISADADRDHPVLTAWLPPQQAAAVCRRTTASVTADWLSSTLPATVTLIGTRADYPPTRQATDEVHLLRAVAVEVTVDDLHGAVLPPGTPVGLRLTPCGEHSTNPTPSGAPAPASSTQR